MKLLAGQARPFVQWVLNGSAFCILDMGTFSTLVLKELGLEQATFQSYLERFGFRPVLGHRNTWKHDRFHRDKPGLVRSIFEDAVAPSATDSPRSPSLLSVSPPPPPKPGSIPQYGPPRTQRAFLDHFPVSLMELLSDSLNATAIAWRSDGLAFTIIDKDAFCSWLLPNKVANLDFRRFISELPQWNFMSLEHQGAPLTWYHPFFRRDRPDLAYQIKAFDYRRSPRAQTGRLGRQESLATENFPATVRSLLSNSQFTHLLTWNSHGLSFTVKDKEGFEQEMCGEYSLGGLGYQAFERKLMEWGFNRIAQDEDFDVWHHTFFRRDRPDLSSRIRQGILNHRLSSVAGQIHGSGSVSTPISMRRTPSPNVEGMDDAYPQPPSTIGDADASHHHEYPLTFMQKLRAALDDESNKDVAHWDLDGIAVTLEFGKEKFQQEILGKVFGGLSYDMLAHELLSYGFDMISNDPGKSSRWQCELFQRRDAESEFDAGFFDVRAEEALGLEDHFPRPQRASDEEKDKDEKARSRRIRVVHPLAKALLQSSAGEPFPESIVRKKVLPPTTAKAFAEPGKGQGSSVSASKSKSFKRALSPPLPPPPPPDFLAKKKRKISAVSTPAQNSNPSKPLFISANLLSTGASSFNPRSEPVRKEYSPRSPRRAVGRKVITSPVAKSMVPKGIPRGITIRPSGKWQAQFYYEGKSRYAGVFDTVDEASIAYEVLRKELKLKQSNLDAKDHDALFDVARTKAIQDAKNMIATGKSPFPDKNVAATDSDANGDDARVEELKGEFVEVVEDNGSSVEAEASKRSHTTVCSSETSIDANPHVHVEVRQIESNQTQSFEPATTLYVARDSGTAFTVSDAPNAKSSRGSAESTERSIVVGGDWLAIFAAAAMYISDDVMTGSLFPNKPMVAPSRLSDWDPITISNKGLFMDNIVELYRAIDCRAKNVKDPKLRAINLPSTLPKTFFERFRRYGYKNENNSKNSPHVYKKTGYLHITPDAGKTQTIYDAIRAIGYKPKQRLELIDVASTLSKKNRSAQLSA